jgi:hypothetical protein
MIDSKTHKGAWMSFIRRNLHSHRSRLHLRPRRRLKTCFSRVDNRKTGIPTLHARVGTHRPIVDRAGENEVYKVALKDSLSELAVGPE